MNLAVVAVPGHPVGEPRAGGRDEPGQVRVRAVVRYSGEHKVKWFSCLDQYLCMAFAQLTYRESLRDIEACLRVQSSKLYHLGFRSSIARDTLANANATRDWRFDKENAGPSQRSEELACGCWTGTYYTSGNDAYPTPLRPVTQPHGHVPKTFPKARGKHDQAQPPA